MFSFWQIKGEKKKLTVLVSAFVCMCLLVSVLLSALTTRADDVFEEYYAAIAEGGIRTVIIDAGHGGEDAGATGVNGRYEKDLNLEVALTLGEYLERAGYVVVYTRTEDKLLYTEEQNVKGFRKINDLKNRVAIANSYPDAIFVSIHMNSFAKERYSGLQVYYSLANEGSAALANSIQKTVRERLQPENNRSCKPGNDIYVMENTVGISVLVECGFLTNGAECEKLSQKEYQKELSFAILCGIIEYTDKEKR